MMKDLTAAIDDAYHIPDVRIWLREYQADNIAQGCRLGAEAIRAAPSSVFTWCPGCRTGRRPQPAVAGEAFPNTWHHTFTLTHPFGGGILGPGRQVAIRSRLNGPFASAKYP